jgi:uncharacterized protein
MLKRVLEKKIIEISKETPAVAILGPRQVGKTTLALNISKKLKNVNYLDLESPRDIAKLEDPYLFFSSQKNKTIILDEIQRMPNIFPVLRGIIDEKRRSGKKDISFLILGSASIDLLKQSSESLAGRISYTYLSGFTLLELEQNKKLDIRNLWLRGSFPDSFLSKNNTLSSNWRENFIKTYIERDIPQLGPRIPSVKLRRLWTIISHLQGTNINVSKLAQNIDVSNTTINRYLDLLEELFLIRRIYPFIRNTKKRLVKTPLTYVRDSGIVHQLLGIKNYEDLLAHPVAGKSWEGFVIDNIIETSPEGTKYYYYKTSAGAEIDLILELPKKKIWAIEIKKSTIPKIKKGFHIAQKDIKPNKSFIVYSGKETYPVSNSTHVISLLGILKKLKNY